MDIKRYWDIIGTANARAGQGSREDMLKHTEELLSELPASEIAQWFNMNQLYLKLADRRGVERAASELLHGVSDDSFLYFRGWLLSLGKEAFYTVLNDPDKLASYVQSPDEARFESFAYVGHEIYTRKKFEEELGADGMKAWEQDWRASNPGEGEYGLQWALEQKYSIWDAAKQNPLGEAEKEEIRQELFAQSANRVIPVVKKDAGVKEIEQVLLDRMPPESKNYRKLDVRIDSGYQWGFGMLPAASQRFHAELGELFQAAGWERYEPQFDSACPEYTKGKSRLYCHPMEITGPCQEQLIPEVCRLLSKATVCTVTKAEDRGYVFDITPEQYTTALESLRPQIERDLLEEFSHPKRGSDLDRHETVMKKYRVMTLQSHSDMLSSSHPYWKYTEEVLKDLIAQGKLVERAGASKFSGWNYITAPEYRENEKVGLDAQVRSATDRTAGGETNLRREGKEPER